MINKQSIWFVTLFSLILVLSIYYVTLNDSSLKSILDTATSQSDSSVSVSKEESSLLVALRVEEDESVLKQMNDYQEILLDANKTSAEKNEAYLSLMALNSKKEEEAKIEKKIKEEFNYDSFVKINKDNINVTIACQEHNSSLANNIMRSIQSLYDKNKYITVKFENA
uniref:SpoIIIAH-like family protein n=1 Tax=Candidatus Ventrenecus sp. TaxID=3085654 RepID=UPI003FEFD290